MAIYTKTGDKGTTALFDGQRVSKSSARVNTYGTFDELNAQISVCEKLACDAVNKDILHELQHKLFRLCAEVATMDRQRLSGSSSLITDEELSYLETIIDAYTKELPEIHSFILSGKYLSAAELHVARTVCRRGERLLIRLSETEDIRPTLLKFVNRLSDCLYILARKEDYVQFIDEVISKVSQKVVQVVHGTTMGCDIARGTGTEAGSEIQPIHNLLNAQPSLRNNPQSIQEIALRLGRAASIYAKSMGVPVVIAVVDDKGVPVLTYRMEDALLVSSELAPGKAYTAVAFKSPTHELADSIQPGGDLFQIEGMVQRNIVTFGGGFPIVVNNSIIGGLGISGGTVQEDMAIALKALQYVEDCDGK